MARCISFSFCLLILVLCSCKHESESVANSDVSVNATIKLQSLPSSETGINFNNKINDEGRINIFTWHFIYNGAGVAVGDINNDGLTDIYFTGNQVPDRLYINKGNFHFEDITDNAGIGHTLWSSGVTMADVNADGLMDIYVSKNSPTGIADNNRNKLYINQGHNLFKEEAKNYGLDDIGFGTQATFFDADQDGDLDVYVVNQPFDEFARLVNRPDVVANYTVTDRFYFNENGKFVDKTIPMGLTEDRYGLNVTLGDYDLNGWTDLYICNDYHHGDRLLLNFNGIFKESVQTHTGHTSFYSMGSDVGDVNNDGWPDLFTLDMAYEEHYRSKTNMGSMDPDFFWSLIAQGQHYQYMQNALLVNNGNGYFSDMAQIGGISKSDWSFSTLLLDLDNDADQDILISNGVLRDMRNNDFNMMVHEKYKNMVGPDNYLEVLHHLPSTPIPNVMYGNDGNLHFTKLPATAGFKEENFSHGMAYADFDGDGLLDLVVNNENSVASIYKNVSESEGHYVNVKLEGPDKNKNGLGCSVIVYTGQNKQFNTMQTTRGYFSSVEPILHFGMGSADKVDSIRVFWNHESVSVLKNIEADKTITIRYSKEKKNPFTSPPLPGMLADTFHIGDFVHREKPYDDYREEVLLPYKLSQNGPFISVGDLNGDQMEDYFIGGAAGNAGAVYFQNVNGTFAKSAQPAMEADKGVEDMESALIDVDGDSDMDLIVVSGSNEFQDLDPMLLPRLYINNGKGLFEKAGKGRLPEEKMNAQCIEILDADGDNDWDLFIGGRLVSGEYAVPASSAIWLNQGGRFVDNTSVRASFLKNFGMVTDAVADDVDKDGDTDLLVVGEWMSPTLLINDGTGKFTPSTLEAVGSGLWWTIEKGDFDKDGDNDYVLGNLGWNNKFSGSKETKLEVYSADFDQSGDYDVVLANTKGDGQELPVRGRECTSEEMPFILDKFPTYDAYARAQITDIYSPEQLKKSVHHELKTLTSIYLQNDGGGKFTAHNLPLLCQAGVIKAFYVADYNQDGNLDFMYAGNHFPTEVETARYDGLYPGVALGDGKGNFSAEPIFRNGQLEILDVRDVQRIQLKSGKSVFVLAVNDSRPRAFTLK